MSPSPLVGRHRALGAAVLALLVGAVLVAPARAAVPSGGHVVTAASILARVRSGATVVVTRSIVQGELDLPGTVRAPLIIRDSQVGGAIVGTHSRFEGLLDLTNSDLRGGLRVRGARFESSLVLEGATIRGPRPIDFSFAVLGESAILDRATFRHRVLFSHADFQGAAHFAAAVFTRGGDFRRTSFARPADFTGAAVVERGVVFREAEFRSAADFSSAQLCGISNFDGVRFSGRADFVGTMLGGPCTGRTGSTFRGARFDAGGDFLAALFSPSVSFQFSRSSGDISFADANFDGPADFSLVNFEGATDFAGAEVGGLLNLDQSSVVALTLTGAAVTGPLRLPFERGRGHLGSLRIDIGSVATVRGVDAEGTRTARQAALALLEATARSHDDLAIANDARVARLTVIRESRPGLPRLLDWIFWWGLLGYLVRPLHQVVALGVVLLGGVATRVAHTRQPGALRSSTVESLRGLFKLRPPESGAAQGEYVLYKALTGALLLSVGNVWPPARQLLEGVF